MKNILNKYKYHIFLTIIVGILFWTNYIPETYLSGWDNLQTELNPGLAVKRAFFSVWEEYQSFGLTAGMAHAADLPRAVFLWLVSLALPQNMIRYFYHFLMLLLGGMGVFELFKKTSTIKNQQDKEQTAEVKSEAGAFFGALFYTLNLGTVQIFYLPFESFSTFFAFLPWGIWIFLRVISNKVRNPNTSKTGHNASLDFSASSRNDWFLFFLINILGMPAFYTQQLFVVYVLILGCLALGQLKNIKKIFLAFLLILVINSFWILPQIYFLKTNGNWITQAKANQISTEDTLYQNLEKGTLDNFLRLEGFYYDLKGLHVTSLFAPWKDHFGQTVGFIQYIFAGFMMIGFAKSLTSAVKNQQDKEQTAEVFANLGFVIIFLLCTSTLLLATPPFSWFNELVRKIPIINQIFRSPFTKFIVPFSLIYSLFVAKGIEQISKKRYFLYGIFFALIILYSLPAFQGFFFSPEMKVKIPSDYFQVMNYFKNTDKNKRIALIPDYTFWGWFFNKWGYNGSGFLWYGIEQPIVSRTFDVWSPKSESYFWEIKQAVEAENLTEFEMVLDKYNVDYLILDYSLIPLVSSYKSLGLDRLENLLRQSQNITLEFQGNNLALFKVDHPRKSENFISIASNLKNIGPNPKIMAEDSAFQEYGDYTTDDFPDYYYPFTDLTTQTRIIDKSWQIEEFGNAFSFASKSDLNFDKYLFHISPSAVATIVDGQKIIDLKLNLKTSLVDKTVAIDFEKALIKSFDVSNFDNNLTEFTLKASELPQKYGYLIKIRSKNVKGSSLFFYINDNTKKQSMIEEKLRNPNEYFILPDKFDYGLGYTLAFQNKSYENFPSENILEEVLIYLFPYQEIKMAKFVKKDLNVIQTEFTNDFITKKVNYFTYKIDATSGQTVILYQAYDDGWLALSDGKLLPHVKVNNWANGWRIPLESQKSLKSVKSIKIIFWPQYLEFLGFGLMMVTFIFILLYKPKIKVDEKNN